MAVLSLQNFSTLVQNFASSVQGACSQLIDFTTGSVLLSVAEASASVGLWMQLLMLQVLGLTRFATSFGSDADTWGADFVFSRLPGNNSTGSVTFSRFTTGTQALILPGAQVKTSDGTQIFTVVTDATQAAWNAVLGGYVIASNASSATVTVQAVNIGTQGNVQANTITLLASAIPFVDTVTNASPYTNGVNAESDASYKLRFQLYIQTRSLATISAVVFAVQSVQQGLNVNVQENTNAVGAYAPGSFVVTFDDGSGNPPAALIAAVAAAVQAVRPVGSTVFVQGPTDTTVTITLTIACNPTSNKTALISPVVNAIIAYVNAIPVGGTLAYSRIAYIAYAVDPSIVDVTAVLVNGATADIVASGSGAIKTDNIHTTVS